MSLKSKLSLPLIDLVENLKLGQVAEKVKEVKSF
jgi:hypothetical protein